MLNGQMVAVFYHCARLGAWEAVDKEIMSALTASGLLDHTDKFVRNECAPDVFEFPTIELLREHAAVNEGAILYLHTKGASRPAQSIDDWRACMLYWTVERWRECVAKLASYDAVGVCQVDTPIPHYQGNFWWATAAHIRKLGDPHAITFRPRVANQGERHKAEFWVQSAAGKFYKGYHHKIDPYATRNPRASYEGRAF